MAKVTRLTLDQTGGLERRRIHLREISDEVDAPLETVGQDLRAARQRKGEDLGSVSKALKIRRDHLEALEESNFETLPGRTYALGFMRTYAEYLGLDPARCVERLKAEVAGREEPDAESLELSPEVERRLPQGAVVMIILLIAAVAYGGYYLSVSANRMLTETVPAAPNREAADEALARAQAEAVRPAPAPAPVPEVPAGPATAPSAEQATGEADSAATAPATAAPANEAALAVLPPGRAYGTRNVNSRVTLRIHTPARVLVQGADDTVFLNRTLRPGDLYQAPNLVGLTLTTANSGAVEIILDGASLGYLGADGAIVEGASLNPQDLIDRTAQAHG
jgi:cytoskeleton protein RodZ